VQGRAAAAVTVRGDPALRRGAAGEGGGLRATRFTLLQALERKGTSPQMALGELLALDSTTLSRTLGALARAGWIRSGASDPLPVSHTSFWDCA